MIAPRLMFGIDLIKQLGKPPISGWVFEIAGHIVETANQVVPAGIMVGLGERPDEIVSVMDDMRRASVDFITIGQYLRPTQRHMPMDRYVSPDEFGEYTRIAREKGFLMVSSSPLTRSSYHADTDFRKLVAARKTAPTRAA